MLQISNFVQINTSQFIKCTGKLSQVILYCMTWVKALFIHQQENYNGIIGSIRVMFTLKAVCFHTVTQRFIHLLLYAILVIKKIAHSTEYTAHFSLLLSLEFLG